jgi:hypothetical protein
MLTLIAVVAGFFLGGPLGAIAGFVVVGFLELLIVLGGDL